MSVCINCKIELTDENWNPSRKKHREYKCKICEKQYRIKYYSILINKENKRKQDKVYRDIHKSKQITYIKNWHENNKEYYKQYCKENYSKNKEDIKRKSSLRRKEYIKTSAGKNYISRQNSRRRDMKNIPLNDWFENSDGHHIDKNYVIYIPKEWNEKIKHNHKIPETMSGINAVAFFFLMQQNIKDLNKIMENKQACTQ